MVICQSGRACTVVLSFVHVGCVLGSVKILSQRCLLRVLDGTLLTSSPPPAPSLFFFPPICRWDRCCFFVWKLMAGLQGCASHAALFNLGVDCQRWNQLTNWNQLPLSCAVVNLCKDWSHFAGQPFISQIFVAIPSTQMYFAVPCQRMHLFDLWMSTSAMALSIRNDLFFSFSCLPGFHCFTIEEVAQVRLSSLSPFASSLWKNNSSKFEFMFYCLISFLTKSVLSSVDPVSIKHFLLHFQGQHFCLLLSFPFCCITEFHCCFSFVTISYRKNPKKKTQERYRIWWLADKLIFLVVLLYFPLTLHVLTIFPFLELSFPHF